MFCLTDFVQGLAYKGVQDRQVSVVIFFSYIIYNPTIPRIECFICIYSRCDTLINYYLLTYLLTYLLI